MVVRAETGKVLFSEGEPAEYLWVLLEGELELSRHISGQKIILMTTDRKGIYAGGFRAYGDTSSGGYRATIRTLRESRIFRLPAAELARLLWKGVPLVKHLLDGLFQTVESIDAMVRQRESLVALGTIAAGLAHELNNPAAAAVRAGGELRSTLGSMQEGLRELAGTGLSPDQLQTIFALQRRATEVARDGQPLDPLSVSDREDVIADWLDG